MSNNTSLHIAKNRKKDCFFTRYEDIKEELSFYPKEQFKDKIVYCNCDTTDSNFYKFFVDNFEKLGLKKIIISCIEYDWDLLTNETSGVYKLEYFGKDKPPNKTLLNGDEKYPPGDFRSSECISLLKEADLVVTNPPFSLFREYLYLTLKYRKKFILVFNQNAIGYKEVFPFFMKREIWLGATKRGGCFSFYINPKYKLRTKNFFLQNGKTVIKFGNNCWVTNMHHTFVPSFPDISKNYYSPEKYPKYDNYDAINVDKISDIPCDYDGVMGVPLTFMMKWSYG